MNEKTTPEIEKALNTALGCEDRDQQRGKTCIECGSTLQCPPCSKRSALVSTISRALSEREARAVIEGEKRIDAMERERNEARRLCVMANSRAGRLFAAVRRAATDADLVVAVRVALEAEKREHEVTKAAHVKASDAWFYTLENLAAAESRATAAEERLAMVTGALAVAEERIEYQGAVVREARKHAKSDHHLAREIDALSNWKRRRALAPPATPATTTSEEG